MKRKSIIQLLIVSLVALTLALTACDATDSLGTGVYGEVVDAAGKPIEGAKVAVFGINSLDNLKAILPDGISSLDDVESIDKDMLIDIEKILKDGDFEDDETDDKGKFSVSMTALAFIVFVDGPEGKGYSSTFKGLPSDKKYYTMITTIKDYVANKGDYPSGFKGDEFIIAIRTDGKKNRVDATLAGGPNGLPASDGVSANTNAPAGGSDVVGTDPGFASAGEKTAPADAVPDKDYFSFSFQWVDASNGAAHGAYTLAAGQPIEVTGPSKTYTYTGGVWSTTTETSRLVCLTGIIPAYANSARSVVIEFNYGGSWYTNVHYIGFDANGVYETRPIYLPEGWQTRIYMSSETDPTKIASTNCSSSILFDDSGNSQKAPFVAIMSYNKGFAVEEEKGSFDYNKVIDLDYMVADIATGNIIAWYDDANESGMLTYDTWFGYGPEVIVGKPGQSYTNGIMLYSEPYSIGSGWNPGSAAISVTMTVTGINGLQKTFTKTFNDNGESFCAGTWGLDGSDKGSSK